MTSHLPQKKKDGLNIPSNEIEKEKEIGRGAYGIVYKAKVIFLVFFFSISKS